ncbi:MAG TPA: hypothetical protein VHB79_21450 [Polyangiaceae bacterium]|nr:hypothetical protein [Polyangiaceae bacterium]
MSKSRRRLAPLVWLVALGACNSIVGIEDLHEGPRPGTQNEGGDGTGATNSTGGKSNVAGDDNPGGTTPVTGGEPSSNAGTGNEGLVGGQGGSGTESPIGGAGGANNPVLSPVHGHVIDFWGKPIPDLPVQIGEVLTSTDAKGEFTVADVPATYDVSMVLNHSTAFGDQSDAWVYLGLSRRDPTLQMFWGGDQNYGYAAYTFNPKPTKLSTQTIWVGFGGPDGNYNHDNVDATGTTGSEVDWYGPTTTKDTLHALQWTKDGNDLPTAYSFYGTASINLSQSDTNTSVNVPFTKGTLDVATMTGTATSVGAGTRSNQVYLGFADSARIKLLDYDGPKAALDAFSYKVPTGIVGGDLTVAAIQGYQYSGFQVAHADALAADAKPALQIPPLVVQLTPAAGAKNVDQTTKFTVKDPGGAPGPYVAMFYSQDAPSGDPQAYQTIFIVTAKPSFTIPTIIGGGFAMYPGNDYLWSIGTFGAYASVDAMVSPGGFIDEFALDETRAYGPRRVSGQYSNSATRKFTTKP